MKPFAIDQNLGLAMCFRVVVCLCFITSGSQAFARSAQWAEFAAKSEEWYGTDEGRRIVANILSYQAVEGGWPKNIDTTAAAFKGDPASLRGTFDNGATTGELRFLARAFRATKEPQYESAFRKGLDLILKAQYPTGGWPQFYPPGTQYHRHITFNDDAMVRLMEFLREVAAGKEYNFVDASRRVAAQQSFERGIQCILKCQVKVNGKLTAWCAQHDENYFSPRSGRSYELVSLSGAESVGIVKLLMSLKQPSAEVIASVRAAIAWFESAKLPGKVVRKEDKTTAKGWDKVVEADPLAKPMWARFYKIETNKPIFSDRDGNPKSSLAEIGYERRNGYAWLGYWPEELLTKDYPAWEKLRVQK